MRGSMRMLNQHSHILESAPSVLIVFKPFVFLGPSVPSDRCRLYSFSVTRTFRLRVRAATSSIGSNDNPGRTFDRLFSFSSSFSSCQPSSYSFAGNIDSNIHALSSSWFWALHSQPGCERALLRCKPPATTVVLLGWLGAKTKHLKRYAEWYNARGMNAFIFCVDVREFICLDLRNMIEERMKALGNELFSWVSKREDDNRGRCLMFHTFSNTGLLVYGYLLKLLRDNENPGLEEKIMGCVVDSGGGGFMDHKVWASGWSAALLKKQSSSSTSQLKVELEQMNKLETKFEEKSSSLVDTAVLAILEKFFSAFLRNPDVQEKLEKIISSLDNPPHCPQLYLYSTADKIVPFQFIESIIDKQKKIGRKVLSHNFRVSPHVDHYRTFPDTYTRLLATFVEECFAAEKGL